MLKRVERDGVSAGSMRIAILAPAETELELVVGDASNPPLELAGVTAVFAELPWIYFEAPAGTVVARYGTPAGPRRRCKRPRSGAGLGEYRGAARREVG